MALTTGERSLHKIASGVETVHGTGVAPTVYVNFESNGIIALDRAPDEPQEDYGTISRHQPSRGTYGVKLAHLPLRGVARFEDLMAHLSCGLSGGVTPSEVVTDIAYLWQYIGDDTADTIDSRTFQDISNIQTYEMTYGVVERIRLSFNALAAPVNAPWQLEVDYIGRDKAAVSASGTPAKVVGAETMMGHLSTASFGAVGTAFNALTPMTGLLMADVTIQTGVTPRKWGGTTDTFDSHGRLNREVTFNYQFWEMSGTKTGLWDTFDVSGALPTDKRCRIACTGQPLDGSHNKQMYIDARLRFNTFDTTEVNGGTVYSVGGVFIDDATLASDIMVSVQNNVPTVV